MTAKRFLFALVLALVPALTVGAATRTEVKLLLAADAARPDETVIAGVRLKMAPRWHTYWRNGGDSGAPTTIEWQLPAGITAGEIQWPVPEPLGKARQTASIMQIPPGGRECFVILFQIRAILVHL